MSAANAADLAGRASVPPQSPGRARHEMTLQWTLDTASRNQHPRQALQSAVSDGVDPAAIDASGAALPLPAEFGDTTVDEACSLVDSNAWHENDLILAAELGKALLERNRDMELQLSGLRGLCEHQTQEIELLTRQVQTLRGLNDGKARMVEEVDRQYAELEARNRDLLDERATARERAAALGKQCSSLEARVEELTQQLEQRDVAAASAAAAAAAAATAAAAAAPSKPSPSSEQGASEISPLCRLTKSMVARTSSYPQLQPASSGDTDAALAAASSFSVASSEARNRRLLSELAAAEQDAELARQECSKLRHQLTEHKQLQQQHQQRLYRPLPPPSYRPLKDADEFEEFLQVGVDNGFNVGTDDLASPIESDVQQIRGDADCGQLQSGGTVFSSTENLSRLGATKKLASTALAEISLLSELNDQYNRLVVEYEQLLAGKRARVSMAPAQSQTHSDETDLSRTAFEQTLSGIFAEETRSERKRLVNQDYRPKYKDLFRDAMSKLRDMKS